MGLQVWFPRSGSTAPDGGSCKYCRFGADEVAHLLLAGEGSTHVLHCVVLPPAAMGKDTTLQLGEDCQCLDVMFVFSLAFTSL